MSLKTTKQWVLPVFIGLALATVFFAGAKFNLPTPLQAMYQPNQENNILVVPIQFDRESYGIAMVDTAGQTIWIYQLSERGPVYNRLKLLAARSWKYDKLLEQYNTAEPKPEQVRALLRNLGQPLTEQTESNKPVLKENEPNSTN
jgi:hypothetical protein